MFTIYVITCTYLLLFLPREHETFPEDVHFCLSAAQCPKLIPDLLSISLLISVMSPLVALCFFFQVNIKAILGISNISFLRKSQICYVIV